MSPMSSFEDIEAWQKARELTRAIYALSNDGPFARDFGLRDQIRRASVSIMSNIAEGFERGGDKIVFVPFLSRQRKCTPKKAAPGVSRPSDSLAGHILKGSL